MSQLSKVLLALAAFWIVEGSCTRAQEPTVRKKAASSATDVRPVRVDIVSLQVSKLPRNQFGQGIKPGTNETVAFWLANSGTALDLTIKLDRPIGRFDEQASKVMRFEDEKGRDLTRTTDGEEINPLFPDNKPIIVKPGKKQDEAEVILRGYGTPTPGATKLRIQADLVFVGGTGERTAEGKDLDPKPGTKATIGPLSLSFMDPTHAQAEAPRLSRLSRARVDAGSMIVAFRYEPPETPIKSVVCLNAEGRTVATLAGGLFWGEQGGTMTFNMPKMDRIQMRVTYYERTDVITVPLRLETGIGF